MKKLECVTFSWFFYHIFTQQPKLSQVCWCTWGAVKSKLFIYCEKRQQHFSFPVILWKGCTYVQMKWIFHLPFVIWHRFVTWVHVWSFETPSTPHGYSEEQRCSRAWSNLALGWVGNRKQQMNERKIESVSFPLCSTLLSDFLICGGVISQA